MSSDDTVKKQICTEHRRAFEYIIELGIRLKAKNITICNAAIFCFKILKNGFPKELCLYTMASSCYLVAGKITNDSTISVRDVINMSHCILHPEKPPLDIDETMYVLRESLLQMELVALRYLRFKVNFTHPHQHLIVMLSILRDWYPSAFEEHKNIDQVAGMHLQDLYVMPSLIVDHKPKTIAVLVISQTFSALKLSITDEAWVNLIQPNLQLSRLQRLKEIVFRDVYKK